MRRSPIRRSSIPGSHASLWLSRWLQLCAGPQKPRENPSLTLRLRVPRLLRRPPPRKPALHANHISQIGIATTGFAQAHGGAAAAPARAKEIPAPDAKKLGLEPTASAIAAPSHVYQKRQKSRGSKIRPRAMAGIRTQLQRQPIRPLSHRSMTSHRASDSGGSKKTVLIAVLVLGLAAAGYFGWTKMHSAHPQPAAPQSAIPASSGTAVLPPQPTASAPETQPAMGEVVTPQPEQV